jgi:adenosylcobyric acid synthase
MPESRASCIAVLGTGSDVGKSVVVTGLCRAILRRGIRVAPFKAQNMSNNSGVTPEGLEMGRAQIVQAEAARIAPQVDMNPVLLKPTSDLGSQVVLLGRVDGHSHAADYHRRKARLFDTAAAALDRLRRAHDLVVLEGAGSCAEVNLMAGDFVNLRMAEQAGAPVVLVADIHRGGVFAQIVGTIACLEPHQRDRIRGFIVNRFRGDLTLFADGVRWIEARTGRPVFGVLPWFNDIRIESEDSVVIESPPRVPEAAMSGDGAVAVIRLPHISNFTDVEPLQAVRGLAVRFLERPQDLRAFRAVILPGSKNTRHDLEWLKASGWAEAVQAHHRSGGHILGVCGGYQMLGAQVHDPDGHEGPPGSSAGLGLLPVETVLKAPKTTTLTRFRWDEAEGSGYEIHMGRTTRTNAAAAFQVAERNGRPEPDEDGCVSPDGRVVGTYLHGLFDAPAVTVRWLAGIGLDASGVPALGGLPARDREYDRLADHLEAHVDVDRILTEAGAQGPRGQAVE